MKYGLIFLLIGVVVIVVSAKRGKAYKAKLESLQAREYVLFEERERLRSEWEKIYEIKKVISDLEKKTEKERE